MENNSASAPGLIVAGGGTGGHVLAGIAIADEWKKHFPKAKIQFVGASGGVEEKVVPRAGYPLILLKLGSLKGVSFQKRLRTLFLIPLSIFKSLGILLSSRPRAVIGVGGYASGPLVLMARFISIFNGSRVAILEQNAVPGLTNRILGRFAHEILCAFPGIEKQFHGNKASVTGNPVRSSMVPMVSAPRRPFTVFIFGGSQGAAGINTLVLDALPLLKDQWPNLRWIHQTGEKDYDRVVEGYKKLGINARVEKFIYDMPECYQAASLVICRSGSSTLSELAAVGRAAVLVPFPFASDNHQEKNARIFTDAGAAQLLIQKSSLAPQGASGDDLARILRTALNDPKSLDFMEEKMRKFHPGNAAELLVDALLR